MPLGVPANEHASDTHSEDNLDNTDEFVFVEHVKQETGDQRDQERIREIRRFDKQRENPATCRSTTWKSEHIEAFKSFV